MRFNPLIFTALIGISFAFSQNKDSFGTLTNMEKNFTTYEKDTTAHAVVLFEKGDNSFEVVSARIQLVKKYHVKIKILDKKGFKEANITIPYYHSENTSEKIKDIKALTHNGITKVGVAQNAIFTKDINERWSEKRFTFPNVKEGSILEYGYTIISPFIFDLNGWDFQSNIPKVYSEFNAKIPGNYVYNRTLRGTLKLDINDVSIKKHCFRVPHSVKDADCEVLKYAMKDVPAFKEEEEFMLAPSNYISRLDFELTELFKLDGTKETYTKTWKDVDHEFRNDKDIGRQLTKKGFFAKSVPEKLLTEGSNLERAQNIYAFVQNHYAWNGKYGIYRNIRVKEAFKEKKGNIGEINISLINLLNSAGIPTNLMLLSTRNNGLPKKTHPVMSDFNYVVAQTKIDGKDYLLDASDKVMPFGMLPFRCLNYYGRVMDFKHGSHWYNIEPEQNNKRLIKIVLNLDPDNNRLLGSMEEINLGYDALPKKREFLNTNKEAYLLTLEKSINNNFVIKSYENLTDKSNAEKTVEKFDFETDYSPLNSKTTYLNPFLVKFFTKDPFLLDQRNYPIDFGYQRSYIYQINIQLPDNYTIKELPAKKFVMLPDNLGFLKYQSVSFGNKITVFYDLSLKSAYYEPYRYAGLKELFFEAVNTLNNSQILLEKNK